MLKKGKLFVFEGADGVGKSTISRMIADYLNEHDIPCSYFTFPGKEKGTLGSLVYKIHHEPDKFGINSINKTSLQVMHIAAHIDIIENNIKPAIKNGRIVILDRFWWSTMVYGIISGVEKKSLESMIHLEKINWGSFLPNNIFLITSKNPLRKETTQKIWGKLCSEYRALSKVESRHGKVTEVKNDNDLSDIFDEIIKHIIPDEYRGNNYNPKLNSSESRRAVLEEDELSQINLHLENKGDMYEKSLAMPSVFSSISPAVPTKVYDTYWRFAAEREEIFFRKLSKMQLPYTDDPILRKYKFTNAYRASDRVSQYLIKNVIYEGNQSPQEVFFRILIFKTFNKIETWELLQSKLGTISYEEYSYDSYEKILTKAMNSSVPIYSAAYIMTSGRSAFGYARKHQNHLKLIELMMNDEVPNRITDLKSMQELFELLISYPTIGDFLAYQYSIDINYSNLTDFSEMSFVVPGPGARDGIRKCFADLGGLNEIDIIKLMANRQEDEFNRLGLNFKSLWGRPLQLIDCQNLFCEVDKYSRVAHPEIEGISKRKKIKQKYTPKTKKIEYWYPPKWGINDLIRTVKE